MKKFNSDCYSHMFSKSNFFNGLLIISFLFFIACSSALYIPSQSNVSENASLDELQKGRQLYIAKCSSCHSLILPEKHTSAEWQNWIEKMRIKAKTIADEEKLILKYVTKGLNTQ